MDIRFGPDEYIACKNCGVKRNAADVDGGCPVCLFSKEKVESVRELTEEQREVLRLYKNNMKPSQIADVTKIPRDKVYELLRGLRS